MNRILCSTGAIIGRPNGRDHRLLAKYAPTLECDGFEFMIYESWSDTLDTVISDVASMGLPIPTVHFEKSIGESFTSGNFADGYERFAKNCAAANRLGAKLAVLHLWNGIPSDGRFENNLFAVPQLDKIASDHGLTLTVENVVCSHGDPQSRLDELAEKTAVHFTFDTKMAAFHRQVMDIFKPEREHFWKDWRISHIHANDYGGGYMDWKNLRVLHIGSGNVPLADFFRELLLRGYQGDYTVESTGFDINGLVDTKLLNHDFAMLRQLISCGGKTL